VSLANGAVEPHRLALGERQRAVPPAGGRHLALRPRRRPQAPAGRVLANTINIGLCLSSAVLGTQGAKLPLIGKADIGKSAEGFVRLIQEALGPRRRHEAIFTSLQFVPGHEFNIFDLQAGCEYPLPLERAFLQNFLALAYLAARPVDTVRGNGAADLARHRRGLSPVYRGGRQRQALSRRGRTGGRRSDRAPRHQTAPRAALLARRGERALRCRGVSPRRARTAPRRADPRRPDRRSAHRPGPRHVRQLEAGRDQREGLADIRALHRRPDPPVPDPQRADPARFRARADHRSRPAIRRADRVGRPRTGRPR